GKSLHLQGPGNVLDGGQPGKQRELLKHHAPVRAGCPDRPSVQADVAGRGRLEAADDVQERALAAAGRSDDGYEFVLIDRERQTINGSDGASLSGERLVEVADLQQGHRRAFSTNVLQRAENLSR